MKKLIAVTVLAGMSCLAHSSQEKLSASALLGSNTLTFGSGEGRLKESSTSWGIRGGYIFNDYFGLDFTYHNFGDTDRSIRESFEVDRTETSANSFTFGLKGSYPLTNSISISVTGGLASWNLDVTRQDIDIDDLSSVLESSEFEYSDIDPYLSLGISTQVSKRLILSIEYLVIDSKPRFDSDELSFEFDQEVRNVSLVLSTKF